MTQQTYLVGSVGLGDAEPKARTVFELLRPSRRHNTHVDLETKVEVLTRELGEALERERATSELLRVISIAGWVRACIRGYAEKRNPHL